MPDTLPTDIQDDDFWTSFKFSLCLETKT